MTDTRLALALGSGALGFVLGDALFWPQWRFLHGSFRREPRVRFYWRTGLVQFPVWAPNSAPGYRSPRYLARWWAAPFIFLLWLVRGLRLRFGWAPRGRRVTVADMLTYHPGKPWRCLCRGEGTIASYRARGVCKVHPAPHREHEYAGAEGSQPCEDWRPAGKGERGLQFCASMLGAFRAKAGFRVVQTKRGPRWLAGFEPEKLVQVTKEVKRG